VDGELAERLAKIKETEAAADSTENTLLESWFPQCTKHTAAHVTLGGLSPHLRF
jgi:DNA primase large subunit